MSEILPSVASLGEKVEGRTALYFFAAGAVVLIVTMLIYKNMEVPDAK